MRDGVQRIVGQGDKVFGRLKELENQWKKLPRDALRIWKNYVA